jgi:hypothetical protein
MKLTLSLFWLIVAGCFFLFMEKDRPRGGSFPYPVTGLALVLAVFNFVRWLASRPGGGGGGTTWQRPPVRRPGDEVGAPDPNFNFTEEPAPRLPEAGPPGPNGAPEEKK